MSAILAADVAGYSRLMHDAEEATHTRLTALLTGGVSPAIIEHGGRIVKNTGDGFLAEFPSTVEAVRAAVIFEVLLSQIGELDSDLASDLIVGSRRYADAARFCDALKPRRNVNAVSKDVMGLDDYVANVDAYAEGKCASPP